MTSLEDLKQLSIAEEFMKQMADKYDLKYVEGLNSLYIEYDANQYKEFSDYQVATCQVATWKPSVEYKYVVYPVCEIKNNEIVTSNDQNTWMVAKDNATFEKYIIQFKKNYKEAQLKLKIKTIEKDF